MPPSITAADLAELLAQVIPDSPRITDPDTPFVLDSLMLTWLLHLLEERHGVALAGDEPQLDDELTLNELAELINGAARAETAPS
ncbi:phosphopantetheine-binding protein [Dactylosporangium sp. CA-139114]|uniref:phosphopantetheine-binding protein n=1 Tax=Dactylosporangium sp. CA-139114 TaxID=3239931 RepID=UPI003D9982CC